MFQTLLYKQAQVSEKVPDNEAIQLEGGKSDSYISADNDDFTIFEGLQMIFKYSFWPIIGMLFHPTYMLVNAIILG